MGHLPVPANEFDFAFMNDILRFACHGANL